MFLIYSIQYADIVHQLEFIIKTNLYIGDFCEIKVRDKKLIHYIDIKMGTMASQITSLTIVYSAVYSGADKKKQTSKLHLTGLCVGKSPGTGEFSAQKASNAENVSIWWRHHVWWFSVRCSNL